MERNLLLLQICSYSKCTFACIYLHNLCSSKTLYIDFSHFYGRQFISKGSFKENKGKRKGEKVRRKRFVMNKDIFNL